MHTEVNVTRRDEACHSSTVIASRKKPVANAVMFLFLTYSHHEQYGIHMSTWRQVLDILTHNKMFNSWSFFLKIPSDKTGNTFFLWHSHGKCKRNMLTTLMFYLNQLFFTCLTLLARIFVSSLVIRCTEPPWSLLHWEFESNFLHRWGWRR